MASFFCYVFLQRAQTESIGYTGFEYIMAAINDKLNMFVVYRSHDIFKAGISNAFGLRALQEHIAKETCHVVGKLAITSNSAHIYEEDWENAKKLCMCEIWERPPKAADNELQEGGGG